MITANNITWISQPNLRGEYAAEGTNPNGRMSLYIIDTRKGVIKEVAKDLFGMNGDMNYTINPGDLDLIQWSDNTTLLVNSQMWKNDIWHCNCVCAIYVDTDTHECSCDLQELNYVYYHDEKNNVVIFTNKGPESRFWVEEWKLGEKQTTIIAENGNYRWPIFTTHGLVWLNDQFIEFVSNDYRIVHTGEYYDFITTDKWGSLYGLVATPDFNTRGIWEIHPEYAYLLHDIPWVDGYPHHFFMDDIRFVYTISHEENHSTIVCHRNNRSCEVFEKIGGIATMKLADGQYLIANGKNGLEKIKLNE